MPKLAAVRRFLSNTGVRIYRIACDVLPGLSGRVYLLLGAGPPTLIDAGSGEGECTAQILAGLKTVRTEFGEPVLPSDLRRIVVTHAHIDHIGGLADLVDLSGADVMAHPLDQRTIAAWDERSAVFNDAFRCFLRRAGVEPGEESEYVRQFGFTPGRMRSVPVKHVLHETRPPEGFQVIHTPGHSPGHVNLVVGNILVAGDHLLPRTVPQQWPESIMPYTGLGHYLESLEKIDQLDGIELVLGGHEPPIKDLKQRITEIRSSHARRLSRLLELLHKAPRPLTVMELTQTMYSHQTGFRALLALTDVGARVEYLDQRGRLEIANLAAIQRGQETAYRYRPAEAEGSDGVTG